MADQGPLLKSMRYRADNSWATMRHLFVLLLTTACLFDPVQAQAPAQATAQTTPSASAPAAGLPPCDKAVRFHAAWFADPDVDNSKTAAELTRLGAGAGSGGGALQLGHVVVETKLAVTAQTSCRGVAVRLDYAKPVLRVASEFAPGSCAHARVMNHELTHVRIHRDIARQFRELEYPWGLSGSSAVILAYAKQELDRLMRAQELFDSPEEYAKNHSVCSGEITRLVKPMAVPAKPAPKSG